MSASLVGPGGGLVGPGGGLVGPSGTEFSFTANAVVFSTRSSSFTANACLRVIASSSFTANASIKRIQTGSFTANAVLFRVSSGSFAANAVLKVSRAASFTADAETAPLPTSYSFTADAVIPPHFTANAVINALVFTDIFDRIVAQGLGSTWTWTDDDFFPSTGPDSAVASVDGISAVIAAGDAAESYTGLPLIGRGWLQFDFWVPAALDATTYGVNMRPDGYYVWTNNSATTWMAYSIHGSPGTYLFPVEPSTWFRVRFQIGLDPANDRVMVWKRSDPEPTVWHDIGVRAVPHNSIYAYLDLLESPTLEPGRLTNLAIWTIESPWTFTGGINAQAQLFRTRSTSFTANARIDPRPFTANAIIKKNWGGNDFSIVSSAIANVSGGSSISITEPAGGITGDILVVAVSFDAIGQSYADLFLSGDLTWTRLNLDITSNSDQALVVYYKVRTATVSTITLTTGVQFSRDMAGEMVVVRGASAAAYLTSRNANSENLVHAIVFAGGTRDQLLLYFWSEGRIGTGSFGIGLGWLNKTSSINYITSTEQTFAAVWGGWELAPATSVNRQIWFHGVDGDAQVTQVQVDTLAPLRITFTADAVLTRTAFIANAWIKATDLGALFTANAEFNRGGRFTADARLSPVGSFTADARFRALTTFFTANAVIRSNSAFLANAIIKKFARSSSYTADAYIFFDETTEASFTSDAWVIGTPGEFTADAQITVPSTPSASFTADAEISEIYRQATFSADAWVLTPQDSLFVADADIVFLRGTGSFTANAFVGGWFSADAWIAGFFANAFIVTSPYQLFTADAIVKSLYSTVFSFRSDAVIQTTTIFTLDAVFFKTKTTFFEALSLINKHTDATLTANAWLSPTFSADAFIQPYFFADAYIKSDVGIRYVPPGGGPPIDLGTGLPYEIPEKKVQIEILVAGVDVTKRVIAHESEFTQTARQSPGSFQLSLYGTDFDYDGGEEVIVNIDGFRQYGGIALTIEKSFLFADYPAGKTVLAGLDFNVLLDHIIIYNTHANAGSGGDLIVIPDSPAGATDQELIHKVEAFISKPWQKMIDFRSKVDSVDIPSPEENFIFGHGWTLRQFLANITQMTNAVAWLNPYYQLEYHTTGAASGPYAIVENDDDGVAVRDLEVTHSIEQLVNDAYVFGVMMKPGGDANDAQIFHSHHTHEDTQDLGFFQYIETRSDLFKPSHVSQRAGAVISRRSLPTKRATCTIFEKGLQAGQVITVIPAAYGGRDLALNLVLRSQRLRFLQIQAPADPDTGPFYGVPAFDLDLRSDKEDPWDLHDMLPWEFPGFSSIDFPSMRVMPPLPTFWASNSTLNPVECCIEAPTSSVIFRDDFTAGPVSFLDSTSASQPWQISSTEGGYVDLEIPPPWCVTGLGGALPRVSISNSNFALTINGFGPSVFTCSVSSQQMFLDDEDNPNLVHDLTRSRPFPFNLDTPIGWRITRRAGYAAFSIWPVDGSAEAVTEEFIMPTEKTLWPDRRLDVTRFRNPIGLAVAAGGGGRGILLNDANTSSVGGLYNRYSSLYDEDEVPPWSVIIGASSSPGAVATGRLSVDSENTWSITDNVPNNVAFHSPGGTWSITQGGSQSNAVSWGTVNGTPLWSGQAETWQKRYGFQGYYLPQGIEYVKFIGRVQGSNVGNSFFFLSYMPNHYSVSVDVGLTSYRGDMFYERQSDFSFANLEGQTGGAELGNPGDTPIEPNLVGTKGTATYNQTFPRFVMGDRFQIQVAMPGAGALANAFPTETPFNLFLDASVRAFERYWEAIWHEPTISLDAGPLGEAAFCTADQPPVVNFGWGQETVAPAADGSFTTTLPAVAETMTVVARGRFLQPGAEWTADEGSDGLLTGTYRLRVPGPKCIQVWYYTPTYTVGQNPSSRIRTSGDVHANDSDLPGVRGTT